MMLHGVTLVSASSLDKDFEGKLGSNKEAAKISWRNDC